MAFFSAISDFISKFFGSILRFFEEKGKLRAESKDFKDRLLEKQKELDELKAKIEILENNAEEFKEKVKLIDFLGGFEEMQKIIDDYGSFAKIREKLLEREALKAKQADFEKVLQENADLLKENCELKDKVNNKEPKLKS